MSLIDKVIEATKKASVPNADGSPLTEAQQAAILIAQVQAILSGDHVTIEPPAEQA
jgi:hypothetical protein